MGDVKSIELSRCFCFGVGIIVHDFVYFVNGRSTQNYVFETSKSTQKHIHYIERIKGMCYNKEK